MPGAAQIQNLKLFLLTRWYNIVTGNLLLLLQSISNNMVDDGSGNRENTAEIRMISSSELQGLYQEGKERVCLKLVTATLELQLVAVVEWDELGCNTEKSPLAGCQEKNFPWIQPAAISMFLHR